jgi:hypothetical protein
MMARRVAQVPLLAAFAVAASGACHQNQSLDEPPPIVTVSVTPQTLQLPDGTAAQLSATVNAPAGTTNLDVTWSSTNPAVATVSAGGVVTGVSPGTAQIVATSAEFPAATGTITVTVTAAVRSVGVAPSTVSVTAGGTQSFSATVVADPGITDLTVTWSSSNTAVATVSAGGLATTLSAGTASIIATSNADKTRSGTGTLLVTAPSFLSVNGAYGGIVSLTTNTATPGAAGLLPSCGGSSEYNEGISLLFDASGNGKVTMSDAPSFPRQYSGMMAPNLTFTSSGTFPFLGGTVPGWISLTVSGNVVTFRETTTYTGSNCANSYIGSLMKN